ncbi:MAG: class I SAM-dependent methyltransferase [Nitrospirota bacterium]
MINTENDSKIRTRPCPNCYLCGIPGEVLYEKVKDCIFGTPGEWSLKKCSNHDCGLIWLDPVPIKEDLGKAYRNYYLHEDVDTCEASRPQVLENIKNGIIYGTSGIEYPSKRGAAFYLGEALSRFDIFREMIADSLKWIDNSGKGRILDIGCGSGKFLLQMKRLGWDAVGIDLDLKGARLSKAKGLEVYQGILEEMSFPEKSFDVITLIHVIEHLEDPLQTLKESRKYLKKGGKLVIVTPNSDSVGAKYFGINWRGWEVPRHSYVFSPQMIEKIVEKSGFRKLVIKTLSRSARYIWKESGYIKNGSSYRLTLEVGGTFFWLFEHLLLRFRPHVGEEVLLIATDRSSEEGG